MEELIAKRYIKAVKSSLSNGSLENMAVIFSILAESFKDLKFVQFVNNPDVSSESKLEILLDAVKVTNSKEISNLIHLLVENHRINIIPAIAEGMRKDVAHSNKTYEGVVSSDSEIDSSVVQDLCDGLSKKFDSKISLNFIKNDFNGIKVDVEDLGVEINFSKSRINNQIIEHIVKAI